MIEGVRALPWPAVHERLKNKSVEMFNCQTCVKHYPRKHRARRKCGWVPTEQWKDPGVGMVAPILMTSSGGLEYDTCPGYTSQLPEVVESASAWGWWDKGQLGIRYRGEPPTMLMDLVEHFNVANSEAQAYYMDRLSKADG